MTPEDSLWRSSRPPAPEHPESGVRAKTIDEWAPERPRRPKKPPGVSKRDRERLYREAEEMRREGRYGQMVAGHFVALYGMCHEQLYGVGPEELASPQEFARARFAAARLLRTWFEKDPAAMAEFVRWAWVREEGREKWRRQNGRDGGRLTWRVQFSGGLVSDYRLDRARRQR